jgi:hypothetical protein
MSNILDPEKLNDIIEKFGEFRVSFNDYSRVKEVNKITLLEFEHRLVEMRADLRPFRKYAAAEWQKRDDKSATGIKFRIAIAIHDGTFVDDKGELVYDTCSINQAEKFASGSQKYKEFIAQRSFYKESLVNVTDLKNDMDGYINLIKDILKTVQ